VNAADFATRLPKGARPRGESGWYDARCPAHEDHRESLSFRDGDRGVIVKCHAGCIVNAIAQAVGVDVAQLFHANGNGRADHAARIVATYDYHDAKGALLYQAVRFEPKDFRQRRPDGRGGWTWNMHGVARVPYRLPELAEQPRVYIVEGEKDADALGVLGLAATTNEGGARKWRPEHTAALVAAAVPELVILPDNDAAGVGHADLVARECQAAGLLVKVVTLPGLPPKGDVSDWLASGHTADELEQLADAAPVLEPAAVVADGPMLVQLSTVAPESVAWIWPGRIPRGKITLVIGEPGDGKSHMTHDLAARLSVGATWPDGGQAPKTAVVILASEDGIADTIRPRVDRQGGDSGRVWVLQGVRVEGQECPFNLERDLPALERALTETAAGLLVIDPLSAYLGTRDSYKDSEIRGILTPLAALAERHHVAVVGILHLTKAATRRLLLRAQGSIAFVAQARVVLAVGEDPEQAGRRFLAVVKNNLGAKAATLAFRLGDDGLTWDAAPVEGTADRLLAQDEAPSRTESRERDDAGAFLRAALAEGPVASKQIEADAKANGIAQRTLWRAKAALGIVADRSKTTEGNTGPWYWRLPA
jgi:putative DNA primase/helicase